MISKKALEQLPKNEPLLIIDWTYFPNRSSAAEYYLLIPIAESDTRSTAGNYFEGYLVVNMSERERFSCFEIMSSEGYVQIAGFTGSAIVQDALRLHLRAYAVLCDTVTHIFLEESAPTPPSGETEYLVRMTGTQARLIMRGAELYEAVHRGRLGQAEEALSYTIRHGEDVIEETPEIKYERDIRQHNTDLLRGILRSISTLVPPAYKYPCLSDEVLRAAEIRASFERQFWMEHPDRCGDAGQLVAESDQPLIKIERVRKDEKP